MFAFLFFSTFFAQCINFVTPSAGLQLEGSVEVDSAIFTGFPRLLESPGFFSLKFQDLERPGKYFGPGKSQQNG